MASFFDSNFTGDGAGPDTDPWPNEAEPQDYDGQPDDIYNYPEPGEGDSFAGEDPSIWDGTGDADEPTAQVDATPPLQTSEQSAVVPDATFGKLDSPEGKENPGDEQTGDQEDDTARPEEVRENIAQDIQEQIDPEDRYDEINYREELSLLEKTLREIDEELVQGWEEILYKDKLRGLDDEIRTLNSEITNFEPPGKLTNFRKQYTAILRQFREEASDIRHNAMEDIFDLHEPSIIDPFILKWNRIAYIYLYGTLLGPINQYDQYMRGTAYIDYEEDFITNLVMGIYDIDLDDQEYEMPKLGSEIFGSLDVQDYIGDAAMNSLLEEFQFTSPEEVFLG